MNIIRLLPDVSGVQLTRIKKLLLIAFTTLLMGQMITGFVLFEDYLVIFVYALFLNDLYVKLKHPEPDRIDEARLKRYQMTGFFFLLFSLPFLFDAFQISDVTRLFLYKIGFILWAQIFLIDAFNHYKETQSKKWLIITNMAALFIVMGSLIN